MQEERRQAGVTRLWRKGEPFNPDDSPRRFASTKSRIQVRYSRLIRFPPSLIARHLSAGIKRCHAAAAVLKAS
jgi:hypothetical protein